MAKMPANATERVEHVKPFQLFGTYELAKLWGVSQRTVRGWIRDGRLRGKRVNPQVGRYFVLGEEVKRFVYEELSDGED